MKELVPVRAGVVVARKSFEIGQGAGAPQRVKLPDIAKSSPGARFDPPQWIVNDKDVWRANALIYSRVLNFR